VFPPNRSIKSEPLGNLNIGKYPEDYKNSVRINRISNLLEKIFNKKLNQIQNQKILQNISQNYPYYFNTQQQNLNTSESLQSYMNTGGKIYDSLSPIYRKRAEIEKVSLDELALLNKNSKRQKSEKSSNCFFNNHIINDDSANYKDDINCENLKSKKYFDKFFYENEEKEFALNSLGNPKSPNEKAMSCISRNRVLNTEAKKMNFYQSVDLSSCSVIKFELGNNGKKENLDFNSEENIDNKSGNVIINSIDEFIFNEKNSKLNNNNNINRSAIHYNNRKVAIYTNEELHTSNINNDLVLNSQQKQYADRYLEVTSNPCYNYYNYNLNDESDLLLARENQVFHSINLSILSNINDQHKNYNNNSVQKALNFAYENISNRETENNKNIHNNNNNSKIQRNISIMDNLSISEENDLNFNNEDYSKKKFNNNDIIDYEINSNKSKIIHEFYQNTKENESIHDLVININNNSELILNYESEKENHSHINLLEEKNLNRKLNLNIKNNNLVDNNFSISNINNNPDSHRSTLSRNNLNNTNAHLNNSIETLNNLNILNSSTETGKFPYINYNNALSPTDQIINIINKNDPIKIIIDGSEEEGPNIIQEKQINNKTNQKSNKNLSKISNRNNINFIDNSENIIIDDQEDEVDYKSNKDIKRDLQQAQNKNEDTENNFILSNNNIIFKNKDYEENIYINSQKNITEVTNLKSVNSNYTNNDSIKNNLNQTLICPLIYPNTPYSNKNRANNILILENNQDEEEENSSSTHKVYEIAEIKIGKSSAKNPEPGDYEPAAEDEEGYLNENEQESENYEMLESFNRYKNNSLNVISEEESNDLETININESHDAKLKKSSVSKAYRENKSEEKPETKYVNEFSSHEEGLMHIEDLSVEDNIILNDYERKNNYERIDEISQINNNIYESNFNSPDIHFNFSNSNLSNSNFKLNSNKNQELKENSCNNLASDNNNINNQELNNFIYKNKKKPSAQKIKNNSNSNVSANNSKDYNNKSNQSTQKTELDNPTCSSSFQAKKQIDPSSSSNLKENKIIKARNLSEKSSISQKKEAVKSKTLGLNVNKKELINKEAIKIVSPKSTENELTISQQREKHSEKKEVKTPEEKEKNLLKSSSIKITSIERSRSRDRRGGNYNDNGLNSNYNSRSSLEHRANNNKFDIQSEKLINKIIDSPNIKVIKKEFFDDENEKSFSNLNKNEKQITININKFKRNIINSSTDQKNNKEEKENLKLLMNKKDDDYITCNENNFDFTIEKLNNVDKCIKKILFRDFLESTLDYIQSIKLLMLEALKKEEIVADEILNDSEYKKNILSNNSFSNNSLRNNLKPNPTEKPRIRNRDKQTKTNNNKNLDRDLESSPVSIKNYQDTIDFETSLIKQMVELSSRTNKIPCSNSIEKKENEKSEFIANQENFVISRITEFAIELNPSSNKLNNFNNFKEEIENYNFSNFYSNSFIEVYSNSISKFSNNNSEIIHQDENKKFYSIENISSADSPLFVMEKQVYLQLNSIGPNKNNLLKNNLNSETEKQIFNDSNRNSNYLNNFNNHEKSELENITEYIDLENMSSLSKSRISNGNLPPNSNNGLNNLNGFNNNTNQNSLENLNYSADSKELSKLDDLINNIKKYENTENDYLLQSENPIINFNSSLLIKNNNKILNSSNLKTNSSNNVNIPEKLKNNTLHNLNEVPKNQLKASSQACNESNLENNSNYNEYKSGDSPLSFSGRLISPDSNRIKSLSDRLEKLKKAKSDIIEKNKKIIENNNHNKNHGDCLASDDFVNLNIKNNREVNSNNNNKQSSSEEEKNYINNNFNKDSILNNKQILTFHSDQEEINSINHGKAKSDNNKNKNKDSSNLDKKHSIISCDFIKIVDNENIHKSIEKSVSKSNIRNSDLSLNHITNKSNKASPVLSNQTPHSPFNPAADESRIFTPQKENTNKTPSAKVSPIHINHNILIREINSNIKNNSSAKNEMKTYDNKTYKHPCKVKSIPSSETKKHKSKILLNKMEDEDLENKNSDNPEYSSYKPHFTTANNFHNPNLFSEKINDVDDYSKHGNSNNHCETLNYTYTNSSGFETLDKADLNNIQNNNNNKNKNNNRIINAHLLHTAEKAKRVFSPFNDNSKNKKQLIFTDKTRNSEVKIIKSIKRDNLVKNFYGINNPSTATTPKAITAINSNRNLSARKIMINNKSNLNLNQHANANNLNNNNSTIAVDKNAGNNYNTNATAANSNENKLKIFKSNPNFSNVKITNIIKKIKSRPSEDNHFNTFNQTNNTINNFNVTCFEENNNKIKRNSNFKNNNNSINNNLNLNHTISGNFYDNEKLNSNNQNNNNNNKGNKSRTSKSGNKSKPNFPQYRNIVRNKYNAENSNSNYTTIDNYNANLNLENNTSNINDLYMNTERNTASKSKEISNRRIIGQNFPSNAEIIDAKNISKSNINIEEDFKVNNRSNEIESNFVSDDSEENISSSNNSEKNYTRNPNMPSRELSKANSVNSNPNLNIKKNINSNNDPNLLTKAATNNSKNLIVKVNTPSGYNNNNKENNFNRNEQKTWSNIKVKKDKNEVKINYMITPNYTQSNNVYLSNAERTRINNSKEKVTGETLILASSKNTLNITNKKPEESSSTNSLANLSNIISSSNKPDDSTNIFITTITTNNSNNVNRNLNEILNKINPAANNENFAHQVDKASNNSSNRHNASNTNTIQLENLNHNNSSKQSIKTTSNLRNTNTSNLINNTVNQKMTNLKNANNNQMHYLHSTNKNPVQVKFNNLNAISNRNETQVNSRIKSTSNTGKRVNVNTSTSSLVLDRCIENLKLALDNYIRASGTDKDMLKNIIRDNLTNIKKENELQKSLHRDNIKNEAENNINFSINSNQSRFENNEFDLSNVNPRPYNIDVDINSKNNNYNGDNYFNNMNWQENSTLRKLISDEIPTETNLNQDQITSKDMNNEIIDDNEFNKLSDDPDDIKNFIINQLESFKLGLVKDRLEKYFEKLRDGTCSPISV